MRNGGRSWKRVGAQNASLLDQAAALSAENRALRERDRAQEEEARSQARRAQAQEKRESELAEIKRAGASLELDTLDVEGAKERDTLLVGGIGRGRTFLVDGGRKTRLYYLLWVLTTLISTTVDGIVRMLNAWRVNGVKPFKRGSLVPKPVPRDPVPEPDDGTVPAAAARDSEPEHDGDDFVPQPPREYYIRSLTLAFVQTLFPGHSIMPSNHPAIRRTGGSPRSQTTATQPTTSAATPSAAPSSAPPRVPSPQVTDHARNADVPENEDEYHRSLTNFGDYAYYTPASEDPRVRFAWMVVNFALIRFLWYSLPDTWCLLTWALFVWQHSVSISIVSALAVFELVVTYGKVFFEFDSKVGWRLKGLYVTQQEVTLLGGDQQDPKYYEKDFRDPTDKRMKPCQLTPCLINAVLRTWNPKTNRYNISKVKISGTMLKGLLSHQTVPPRTRCDLAEERMKTYLSRTYGINFDGLGWQDKYPWAQATLTAALGIYASHEQRDETHKLAGF